MDVGSFNYLAFTIHMGSNCYMDTSLVPRPPTARQVGGSGRVLILVPIYGASHHPLGCCMAAGWVLVNFRRLLSRENDKTLHLYPAKQKEALQ